MNYKPRAAKKNVPICDRVAIRILYKVCADKNPQIGHAKSLCRFNLPPGRLHKSWVLILYRLKRRLPDEIKVAIDFA